MHTCEPIESTEMGLKPALGIPEHVSIDSGVTMHVMQIHTTKAIYESYLRTRNGFLPVLVQ